MIEYDNYKRLTALLKERKNDVTIVHGRFDFMGPEIVYESGLPLEWELDDPCGVVIFADNGRLELPLSDYGISWFIDEDSFVDQEIACWSVLRNRI